MPYPPHAGRPEQDIRAQSIRFVHMNLVDFAKHLNLSVGTVSRAFNNHPEVSDKTRRLVLEKAQELGFARNSNARRLVTGRSYLLQLECPFNTHILADRYLVELARALEEAARGQGYDLLLHLGTHHNIAESQTVDGVIIMGAPEITEATLRQFTCAGRTPAVVITELNPIPGARTSYVCLDTLTGVREAIHLLAMHGHRRVGYIGNGYPGYRLPSALTEIMSEVGLTWNPELSIEAGETQELGTQAAMALLKRQSRPTALFCRTDILAGAAVQGALELGLRVPEDVSVIGHDDIEIAAYLSPPLTTVSLNIPRIASAAMGSLLTMIKEDAPPSIRVLGTHLVVRGSVGPAAS
jgi:DNA-binding LacI/PurR family transcriptional regulator